MLVAKGCGVSKQMPIGIGKREYLGGKVGSRFLGFTAG